MAVIPSDVTLGTGTTIGRYFSIVSVIPSVLLAGWIDLILATGVLSEQPHVNNIGPNLGRNQPFQALTVASCAVVFALLSHPLQRATTQLLEGYWTGTKIGRDLQARRIQAYLDRLAAITKQQERSIKRINRWERAGIELNAILLTGGKRERNFYNRALLVAAAANRSASRYPELPIHVMPTRLGNMLRRHEMRIGVAYHLPILSFATHMGFTAEPSHTVYLNDQRSRLDLSTRLVGTSLLATLGTVAVMWPQGPWLLTALIPYLAAYVSYRGAVSAADSYGQALAAWSDLNRFRLYDALHLPPIITSRAERVQNDNLEDLVLGDDAYQAVYKHPNDDKQSR